MAQSSTVVLKAAGLVTSPNELDRPEGSLIEASNIIVRRDGIIEQRRGFALFGDSFPSTVSRAKQLSTYRSRILRHYGSVLQYDSTGAGKFNSYTGSVNETQNGLRLKFTESNGNLYFTTSQGVKKLSAANSSQLSDINPELSGVVKALDLSAETIYEHKLQTGFLPQESAVAYRIVWNTKDNNNNRITGTPSQRALVYNGLMNLMLRDFASVLSTLDNLTNSPSSTARISDANYVSTLVLPITASGSDLRTKLIALATKLDTDIILANAASAPLTPSSASISSGVCTINFSSGDPTTLLSAGDSIMLSGFTLGTRNEIQTLSFSPAPTAGTFNLRSGTNETTVLNWNDNATTIQTALRLVSGNQNVVVTGSIAAGLTLTYITADGDMPQVQAGSTNTLNNAGTPTSITGATTQTGIATTSGTLNAAQTVSSLTSSTIVFNTDAIGTVDVTAGVINSNIFRIIEQPEEVLSGTADELTGLQNYLDNIILALQDLPDAIVATGTDKTNIDNLDITTTVNTSLTFSIPAEIQNNDTYYYQVYRSSISTATGASVLDDIVPNDELQLVHEDCPTTSEFSALQITITDETPDDFRGENLYTNGSTGEGILQSNDQAPFAKDINRYRNSVFYANTRTKQRLSLSLIGVQNMINDYDAGTTPKLTISNGDVTNTYNFVTGQQQITEVHTVADVADSLNGKYFLYNTPTTGYYVWYNTTAGVDPAIAGRTGIEVNITTGDSANTVAEKTYETLVIHLGELIVSVATNVVEITNVKVGDCTDATAGDSGFTVTVTQDGRGERIQPQITSVTAIAGSAFVTSGLADYFSINSAFNQVRYVVWFNTGTVSEPNISGKINLEVSITGSETAAQVAQKIADVLPTSKFSSSVLSNVATITNVQAGSCTDASENVSDAGFLVSTTQSGAVDILLSPEVSPARAVEQTSNSLVKVINKNLGESVYAFYLSGAFDIPGKMLLEARSLQDENPFYVVGNNEDTGNSFSPSVSPEVFISSIATGTTTSVITTTTAHGLTDQEQVVINATNSTPIIDGIYTATVLTSTTFSIPTFVTGAGTTGALSRKSFALASENEEKPNRVYYSKYSQPEAVPIGNYFDVGASDKAILRILPLRDSLFVFKEDGLFRISGDSAPFQLELFDNSFILLAPDSAVVCNNAIYAWTTQGIQQLTEGGAYVISRNIDNQILRIQSSAYINFKTATWGVGYESDNSYIVFTVSGREDDHATIAYRYSTLTQTWTTYDKSNTCGVVNNFDDKLYLGAADVPYIEKERKNFDRTDYADREFETTIGSAAVQNYTITLPDVSDIDIGDVFVQEQTMTVYDFNGLLKKLDLDTGVGDTDYFDALEMVRGDSPRNKLVALATKLDGDSIVSQSDFATQIASLNGMVTSNTAVASTVITDTSHGLISGRMIRIVSSNSVPSIDGEYQVTVLSADTFSIPVTVTTAGTAGTWETLDDNFEDIKTCFNKITSMLNSDVSVNFANYKTLSHNTIQESIIVDINRVARKITLNLLLDYIVGAGTVFKAITTSFTYSPNTFGDPLMLKQLAEATMMFETRNITSGVLSFGTDLLPEMIDIEFDLDGNGIFGHTTFGLKNFGGIAGAAPFRTYIPRQCQRCRYMVVKFEHSTAREDYRVTGLTLTGRTGISPRAFR